MTYKKKKYVQPHTISIALPKALHEELKKKAASDNRSLSSLFRILVTNFLKRS